MSDEPRERFQEILKSFTTGMLVTRGSDNELRGRPMRVADVASDADQWFSTDIDSGKTDDIDSNPNVVVTFQDSGRFLTVSGTATISRDADRLSELWNESWRVWFPDGQDDPSLALLHVDATHGEYWDNGGLRRLSYAIKAGQAYWTGQRPEISKETNAKVKIQD